MKLQDIDRLSEWSDRPRTNPRPQKTKALHIKEWIGTVKSAMLFRCSVKHHNSGHDMTLTALATQTLLLYRARTHFYKLDTAMKIDTQIEPRKLIDMFCNFSG